MLGIPMLSSTLHEYYLYPNTILICVYMCIQTDIPTAPNDFTLEPSLTLLWTRPSNVPLQVSTYYTVEINATEDGGMKFKNFTSDTSLSVQFLEKLLSDLESECVEFEFFVRATNDAGTGPSVRVVDTVPICKLLIYCMFMLYEY